MLSHAMAHSPGRFTKKTTLHSTAASASRDPTQTAQFSRFLLASGMTGGVYQTFGGAILGVPGRGGTPRLVANRPFETISRLLVHHVIGEILLRHISSKPVSGQPS